MPISRLATPAWVEGELKLAGNLDTRLMALLKAIADTGSINQAAKQVGLSYKGAWQIIERANNLAPKVLVATTTGGSKGGGTCLTAAGLALLALFEELQVEHRQFLLHINQRLAANPDICLLMQRQVIKTSASNQLFGTITAVAHGVVNAKVSIMLKGGEIVSASVAEATVLQLDLQPENEAVLLLNSQDLMLVTENEGYHIGLDNRLSGTVIRINNGAVHALVVVQLPPGETLTVTVTQPSLNRLQLQCGMPITVMFHSRAVILGVGRHDEFAR